MLIRSELEKFVPCLVLNAQVVTRSVTHLAVEGTQWFVSTRDHGQYRVSLMPFSFLHRPQCSFLSQSSRLLSDRKVRRRLTSLVH